MKQQLQWDQQCQAVRKKLDIGDCILNTVIVGRTEEERRSLHRACKDPHTDHCAPDWSVTTDKNLNKIELAQRICHTTVVRLHADEERSWTYFELFEKVERAVAKTWCVVAIQNTEYQLVESMQKWKFSKYLLITDYC